MWIKTATPLAKDQEYKVKVYYQGELFRAWEDWISIRSPSFWYPQVLGRTKRAKFDLTFHSPADFDFISVGKKETSKTKKKVTTSRWVTEKAVRQASFNIGKFNNHKLSTKNIPPVTVSISKVYPSWIEQRYVILKNSEKMVAECF